MSADRERLAAVTISHRVRAILGADIECACGWIGAYHSAHLAHALLPVVQALVAEGKAEELWAQADGAETGTWRDPITGPDVAAMLRARADALTAGSEAGA